jgi:hypothetical protein
MCAGQLTYHSVQSYTNSIIPQKSYHHRSIAAKSNAPLTHRDAGVHSLPTCDSQPSVLNELETQSRRHALTNGSRPSFKQSRNCYSSFILIAAYLQVLRQALLTVSPPLVLAQNPSHTSFLCYLQCPKRMWSKRRMSHNLQDCFITDFIHHVTCCTLWSKVQLSDIRSSSSRPCEMKMELRNILSVVWNTDARPCPYERSGRT